MERGRIFIQPRLKKKKKGLHIFFEKRPALSFRSGWIPLEEADEI